MDTPVETWTVEIVADTAPLQMELQRVSGFSAQFGRALTRSFEGIALKGKSVSDVVRGLGQQLSQLAFRAAFKPLERSLSGMFNGLFGGLFGGAKGFAKGGLIQQGMAVPFASGGVVSSPTFFPMAGGRTGVMGERGAEAILPLARGPDGRLGVRSGGGGAVSVNVQISTPDVEGFRKSETQVAALLARAVSQGQRNL